MSYPDSMDSVSNKSHDRVSRAIIIHFTKSMLDGTFLGHFRRPATTCPAPPAERKDKDGSKSSLLQSLIAACRIMITLPPSKHHHDKPKGFPTIKGDKSPGTIKGPHTVKKATICWGLGEQVKIEEIQVDPPRSLEARVRVLYASLCHTDIVYCRGGSVPLFPRVPGHEGVG
ncbi:Alcohol dehydrogenase 1 [Vitis vinifera]|uniref:Alcohol dehydrogenase 1 n=1 Tax=Vitis vinifera TaxID=29760 RepID=A0A438BT15_VITVI|nr:Alcohol dehydrogenase 1 [Vitis vinifera]